MRKLPPKVPMEKIKALTKGPWFSPSTMAFFDSKLPDYGYLSRNGNVYFYTSEQFHDRGYHEPRRYTVRMLDIETHNIETVGAFQRYGTSRAANTEARRLAIAEEEKVA